MLLPERIVVQREVRDVRVRRDRRAGRRHHVAHLLRLDRAGRRRGGPDRGARQEGTGLEVPSQVHPTASASAARRLPCHPSIPYAGVAIYWKRLSGRHVPDCAPTGRMKRGRLLDFDFVSKHLMQQPRDLVEVFALECQRDVLLDRFDLASAVSHRHRLLLEHKVANG